jgi:hypothetical protein
LIRVVKIAAVVLLSLSLGLHWAVLQSVAWTSMLVERSQTTSFRTALQTTFDGQHPCKLCQVVRAGKSAEKQSEALVKLAKLDSSLPEPANLLPAHPRRVTPTSSPVLRAKSREDAPPLPPPRG